MIRLVITRMSTTNTLGKVESIVPITLDWYRGSNRKYREVKSIRRQYTAGASISIFVNADDPSEAVINRDFQFSWLGLLFSSIFSLVGLGIIYASFRPWDTSSGEGSARYASVAHASGGLLDPPMSIRGATENTVVDDFPLSMGIKTKRKAIAGAISFFALFWNGFVLFALFDTGFSGFSLFLMPFVLVGIGLIVWAFRCILTIFAPYPEVEIPDAITVGQRVSARWRIEGPTKNLRSVVVKLEAQEVATYERGTDTVTEKHEFFSREIARVQHFNAYDDYHQCEILIPEDGMPSFVSKHNRIEWLLRFEGDIARWPDFKEEFKILVTPKQEAY